VCRLLIMTRFSFFGKYCFWQKEIYIFLIEHFCSEIVCFFRVVLLQIDFGSGSCKKFWIRPDPDPQHSRNQRGIQDRSAFHPLIHTQSQIMISWGSFDDFSSTVFSIYLLNGSDVTIMTKKIRRFYNHLPNDSDPCGLGSWTLLCTIKGTVAPD
jgi:hypothetical protein